MENLQFRKLLLRDTQLGRKTVAFYEFYGLVFIGFDCLEIFQKAIYNFICTRVAYFNFNFIMWHYFQVASHWLIIFCENVQIV